MNFIVIFKNINKNVVSSKFYHSNSIMFKNRYKTNYLVLFLLMFYFILFLLGMIIICLIYLKIFSIVFRNGKFILRQYRLMRQTYSFH